MVPQSDFKKLVDKVMGIPIGNWKKVDTFHRETYFSELSSNYKVIVYRDWEVESGKPDWTGRNSYGFSVVKDLKSPLLTELANFKTGEIYELFQNISKDHYKKLEEKSNKIHEEKRQSLSNLISKL